MTPEECEKMCLEIMGVPASYEPEFDGICGVLIHSIVRLPVKVHFNGQFVEMNREDQEVILAHEMGHVFAMQKYLPNTMAMEKVVSEQGAIFRLALQFDKDIQSAVFKAEAEADYYAARHLGLQRVLRTFSRTFPTAEEIRIRTANLLCYIYLHDEGKLDEEMDLPDLSNGTQKRERC